MECWITSMTVADEANVQFLRSSVNQPLDFVSPEIRRSRRPNGHGAPGILGYSDVWQAKQLHRNSEELFPWSHEIDENRKKQRCIKLPKSNRIHRMRDHWDSSVLFWGTTGYSTIDLGEAICCCYRPLVITRKLFRNLNSCGHQRSWNIPTGHNY